MHACNTSLREAKVGGLTVWGQSNLYDEMRACLKTMKQTTKTHNSVHSHMYSPWLLLYYGGGS